MGPTEVPHRASPCPPGIDPPATSLPCCWSPLRTSLFGFHIWIPEVTKEKREGWDGVGRGWGWLVVMNSSWPRGGGGDPLPPEGAVEGQQGAELGVVACEFGLQAPLGDPCPPLSCPRQGPPPHFGQAPLSSLAGAPSHLDLITPTLASPRARGPLKGWSMRWRGTRGVGVASCSAAQGGSLDVCRGRGWGGGAADCWPPQLLVALCCGSLHRAGGHCELGLRAGDCLLCGGERSVSESRPPTSFSYVCTWGGVFWELCVYI